EKFLDTPVKRYSSGMYVRLAFAVAAHLEPEILIVDEVLAVGDAAFQKRCLGKMDEVGKQGRTVLFVSHNISAVKTLCTHGVVLDKGNVVFRMNSSESATDFYIRSTLTTLVSQELLARKDRVGSGYLKFKSISFLDDMNQPIHFPICGKRTTIIINYHATKKLDNINVGIVFNSLYGENKIVLFSDLVDTHYDNLFCDGYFQCYLEKFPLSPGSYSINLYAENSSSREIIDWIREAMVIEVQYGDFFGTGKLPNADLLSVCVQQQWT
ncbi:MAG: ABC transporter ATP-binding protein, partial [Dolichospermum sp.]